MSALVFKLLLHPLMQVEIRGDIGEMFVGWEILGYREK